MVGGLGVAPGANIGTETAVFEATHGSAPKYKGQNKVNPTAMILSGKLMLDYLGETEAATTLENAVASVIAEGKSVTYDMKPDRNDPTAVGTASTPTPSSRSWVAPSEGHRRRSRLLRLHHCAAARRDGHLRRGRADRRGRGQGRGPRPGHEPVARHRGLRDQGHRRDDRHGRQRLRGHRRLRTSSSSPPASRASRA
jgi:hypothetical protein